MELYKVAVFNPAIVFDVAVSDGVVVNSFAFRTENTVYTLDVSVVFPVPAAT